jgi:hypothetical protein
MDDGIVFGSPLLHLRLLLFMSYVFFSGTVAFCWLVCVHLYYAEARRKLF